MKPDQVTSWCTFKFDGGRCHVRLTNTTLCGMDVRFATFYTEHPGKRICRECRERLEQMEDTK